MTRRGRTGVKYEVDTALKAINRIGSGKRATRNKGDHGNIHSYTQNEKDYAHCMDYGKWLRSTRNKGLYQTNRGDYRDYIAHKSSTCGKGELTNIETSLRHLSKGMNKVSDERGKARREWIPKTRIISSKEKDKPYDRSYTTSEASRIREQLPTTGKTRDTHDLQNAFGLRLKEASKARASNFETRGDTTYFVAHQGNKITKGGRPRETPCRPEYERQVREIITRNGGRSSSNYVGAKYNTARDAYRTAAAKAGVRNFNGSHGYRHTYARAELERRLAERGLAGKGREVIDRMLANYDNGIRKDTGFAPHEKSLYRVVNRVIDQVHESLGHGPGRLDLVAVYMR